MNGDGIFQWDDAKAIANVERHGVTFEAARGAFKDPFALDWLDESEDYGEERTHDLLQRHPDLCGFYMGGSGIEGVLRALRAHKRAHRIVGVGNEITSVTRSGLLSGHFHVVLAHPLPLLCQDLVDAMADVLARPGGVFRQVLVPMESHVPQSV